MIYFLGYVASYNDDSWISENKYLLLSMMYAVGPIVFLMMVIFNTKGLLKLAMFQSFGRLSIQVYLLSPIIGYIIAAFFQLIDTRSLFSALIAQVIIMMSSWMISRPLASTTLLGSLIFPRSWQGLKSAFRM